MRNNNTIENPTHGDGSGIASSTDYRVAKSGLEKGLL